MEIPSGHIEKNETPLKTAKRELKEEAGAESDNWKYLGSHWHGIGCIKIKGHILLARNVRVKDKKTF